MEANGLIKSQYEKTNRPIKRRFVYITAEGTSYYDYDWDKRNDPCSKSYFTYNRDKTSANQNLPIFPGVAEHKMGLLRADKDWWEARSKKWKKQFKRVADDLYDARVTIRQLQDEVRNLRIERKLMEMR